MIESKQDLDRASEAIGSFVEKVGESELVQAVALLGIINPPAPGTVMVEVVATLKGNDSRSYQTIRIVEQADQHMSEKLSEAGFCSGLRYLDTHGLPFSEVKPGIIERWLNNPTIKQVTLFEF